MDSEKKEKNFEATSSSEVLKFSEDKFGYYSDDLVGKFIGRCIEGCKRDIIGDWIKSKFGDQSEEFQKNMSSYRIMIDDKRFWDLGPYTAIDLSKEKGISIDDIKKFKNYFVNEMNNRFVDHVIKEAENFESLKKSNDEETRKNIVNILEERKILIAKEEIDAKKWINENVIKILKEEHNRLGERGGDSRITELYNAMKGIEREAEKFDELVKSCDGKIDCGARTEFMKKVAGVLIDLNKDRKIDKKGGVYRDIGITVLNILTAIGTLFGVPIIKNAITGTPFFSWNGKTRDKVDKMEKDLHENFPKFKH